MRLDPDQRIGVLATEVIEGRDWHPGGLEQVQVRSVAEREVDEERQRPDVLVELLPVIPRIGGIEARHRLLARMQVAILQIQPLDVRHWQADIDIVGRIDYPSVTDDDFFMFVAVIDSHCSIPVHPAFVAWPWT